MSKIVTIGGGELSLKETFAIDAEIIRLTGKKKPAILYIPTASSDSEIETQEAIDYFSGSFGITCQVLPLVHTDLTQNAIEKMILSADIVYVGGGNTLKMMRRWRHLNIDRMLKKAQQKNIVLCGVSAGSICWYESGHSDSWSYYSPSKWKYVEVKGLGFLPGVHCPHFNSETRGVPREKFYFQMMQKKKNVLGIAIDDNCAIEYIDDTYRVITSKKGAGAYTVVFDGTELKKTKIPELQVFKPLSELYTIANLKR